MFDKHLILLAASFLAVIAGCIVISDNGSDAATGETLSGYGAVNEVSIAPGYTATYTLAFPADLVQYLNTSLQVNDASVAEIDDENKLLVYVHAPSNAAVGTKYNVVIKAYMTSPVVQEAYQYLRFTVVSGLSASAPSISDIVLGGSINATLQASSNMATPSWSFTPGHAVPEGLSISNGKLVGTPTSIGTKTVYLTATAAPETRDVVATFKVYSPIASASAQTITSYGSSVSSSAIAEPADISVAWYDLAGALPQGFTLNASTGVVSGSSSTVQSVNVTLTGKSTQGPLQSVTKVLTIRSEPALTLASSDSILTYKGNQAAVTASISAPTTSQQTWSVSSLSGATVTAGTLSVKNSQSVGMLQTATVTVSTAYGQTKTIAIPVAVEDTLGISGDALLNLTAGTEGSTSAFSITGGSSNNLSASTDDAGLTVRISGGKLYATCGSPDKGMSATVTVTSAAGQTASADVTVDVYSKLIFTSVPTGGAIIYAV